MTLGLLFSIIFRNNALSIIMFILYFFPIEPIIRAIFKADARRFFPMKIISNLTPTPEFLTMTSEKTYTNASGKSSLDLSEIGILPKNLPLGITVALAAGYIGFFIALSYLLINRKNL